MIWALLLASAPLDPVGDPLDRYLTVEAVMKALEGLEPALRACPIGKDETVALTMDWSGDGTANRLHWEPEKYSTVSCWTQAIAAHRFPVHDDEPERVGLSLYVRDGALVLSPVPKIDRRATGPLLLFVSGTEGERSRIEEYLAGTEPEEQ